MAGPSELPHLIDVHPTRSVAVGALVGNHGGLPAVLMPIDLGYPAKDHEVATEQLSKLLPQGFAPVSGLDEVYQPVYSWSYRPPSGRSWKTPT